MEQPKIQSKADNFTRLIYIIATLFFGCIGYFISIKAFQDNPLELGILIISLVFWVFALWGFLGIWYYYDTIKIYSDRLEVSNWGNLYHRTISFNDISGIEIEVKNSKYTTWEECTIRVNKGRKYRFNDKSYTNYLELKRNLNQKQIKDIYKNDLISKKAKFIGNAFIICFTCFLVFAPFYCIYQYVYFTIDRNSVVEIPLNLSEKSHIIKRSKGSNGLSIYIKEYPKFNFSIYDIPYSATNTVGFIENTEGGNKVYLMFKKEEYQQKLSKEKEVTFWNKYFNYYRIDVYGIRDDKKTYLTLEDYITESKSSNRTIFLWLLALIFLMAFLMREEISKAIFKKPKRRKY
jgi:hypothetical protein